MLSFVCTIALVSVLISTTCVQVASAEAIAEARKKELDRLKFSRCCIVCMCVLGVRLLCEILTRMLLRCVPPSKFLRYQELEIELEEHRNEIERLQAMLASGNNSPVVVGKLRLSAGVATISTTTTHGEAQSKKKRQQLASNQAQDQANTNQRLGAHTAKPATASFASGTVKVLSSQRHEAKKESFVAKTRRRAQEAEYYKQVRLAQLEAECELEENIHIRTAREVKARLEAEKARALKEQQAADAEQQRAKDEAGTLAAAALLRQKMAELQHAGVEDQDRDFQPSKLEPSSRDSTNSMERDAVVVNSSPAHGGGSSSDRPPQETLTPPTDAVVSINADEKRRQQHQQQIPGPEINDPEIDNPVFSHSQMEPSVSEHDEYADQEASDAEIDEVPPGASFGVSGTPANDPTALVTCGDPLAESESDIQEDADDAMSLSRGTPNASLTEKVVVEVEAEYLDEENEEDIVVSARTSARDSHSHNPEQMYAEENFDDNDTEEDEAESAAAATTTHTSASGPKDARMAYPGPCDVEVDENDSTAGTDEGQLRPTQGFLVDPVDPHTQSTFDSIASSAKQESQGVLKQGFLVDPVDPHATVIVSSGTSAQESTGDAVDDGECVVMPQPAQGFLVDSVDLHTQLVFVPAAPTAEGAGSKQGFLVDVVDPHTCAGEPSVASPQGYADDGDDEAYDTDSPHDEPRAAAGEAVNLEISDSHDKDGEMSDRSQKPDPTKSVESADLASSTVNVGAEVREDVDRVVAERAAEMKQRNEGGDDGGSSTFEIERAATQQVPSEHELSSADVITRQIASGLESANLVRDAMDRKGSLDVMPHVHLSASEMAEAMDAAAKKIQQFWRQMDARFRRDQEPKSTVIDDVPSEDEGVVRPRESTSVDAELESPLAESPREDELPESPDDEDPTTQGDQDISVVESE